MKSDMKSGMKQDIVYDLTQWSHQHYAVLLWATQDTTLEDYTPLTPLADEARIFEQYWSMRNNPIRFGSRYPKIMRGILNAWLDKELSQ